MAQVRYHHTRHPDDVARCGFCRRIELVGSGIESSTLGEQFNRPWFCCQTCLCMALYENGTASAFMNNHEFYQDCLRRFYPSIYARRFGQDVKGRKFNRRERIVGEAPEDDYEEVEEQDE